MPNETHSYGLILSVSGNHKPNRALDRIYAEISRRIVAGPKPCLSAPITDYRERNDPICFWRLDIHRELDEEAIRNIRGIEGVIYFDVY